MYRTFACIFLPLFVFSRLISIDDLLKENYTKEEWQKEEGFAFLKRPLFHVWSYPSSGNTWTRYALEYLTKHPSIRVFNQYSHKPNIPIDCYDQSKGYFIAYPFGLLFEDMQIDFSKSFLIKSHNPFWTYEDEGLLPLIKKEDKVIFLLRNYLELYFRNQVDSACTITTLLKEYFDLLNVFDEWPSNQKILIYFEDLMLFPKKTFQEIIQFMDESEELLESFLENLPFHQERTKEVYKIIRGEPKSFHNVENFYSKPYPLKLKKELEECVRNEYPELFEKYLKRYELPK